MLPPLPRECAKLMECGLEVLSYVVCYEIYEVLTYSSSFTEKSCGHVHFSKKSISSVNVEHCGASLSEQSRAACFG